jgi:hypothetical protein
MARKRGDTSAVLADQAKSLQLPLQFSQALV